MTAYKDRSGVRSFTEHLNTGLKRQTGGLNKTTQIFNPGRFKITAPIDPALAHHDTGWRRKYRHPKDA